MFSRHTQWVVKAHRPWRNRILAGVTALAVIAAGWALYALPRAQLTADQEALLAERKELRGRVATLEARNAELRERAMMLEQALQVEQATIETLQATVRELHGDLAEAREQVAFFRGLVTPEGSGHELRVQNVTVLPGEQERLYRYRVVLTRSAGDNTVRGRLELQVDGTQDDQLRRMPLSEISLAETNDVGFRLRYLQAVEGELLLPEGFDPHTIHVAVFMDDESGGIEQSFDWPDGDSVAYTED